MKTIRIENVQEAMSILVDLPYDEKREIYRNLYVYRGLPNVDYKLITSLRRNCGKKQKVLEQHILDNFAKYAENEASSMLGSVWKRMILGQHHGLPTRLLDWTRSPLVALHFAMTESDYKQMDQRVANQYSFFAVIPSGMDDIGGYLEKTENTVKYVIGKEIRWHLRDALDQMSLA